MLKMAMEVLQMILLSTLALQDILSSNRAMIMKLLLLHSKSQIMPMLGMILRLGLVVHPGSKLHLGQKPNLGGRYTNIVHSYMHNIWSVLCISIFRFLLMFLFYFNFLKHKKIKKISVVSLVFCLGGF